MFLALATITTVISLAVVIAGVSAFLRNPSKRLNQSFLVMSTCIGLWALFNFFGSNTVTDYTGLLIKLDFIFALVLSWVLLIFAGYYAKEMHAHSWTISNRFIIASGLVVLAISGFVANNYVGYANIQDGILEVKTGSFYIPYTVINFGYIALGLTTLLRVQKSSKKKKSNIGLMIMGFVVAVAANILTNVVFPGLIESRELITRLNIIGYIGLAVLAATIYITITKQQLFDLRFYVVRTLAYGFTLVILGLLFLVPVIYVIAKSFGVELSPGQLILLIFVALGIISFYGYLRNLLNTATNKVFFRNEYDPQQFIAELNKTVVSNLDISSLLVSASKVIESNFKAEFCLFLLHETPYSAQRILGADNKMLIAKEVHDIAAAVEQVGQRVAIVDYMQIEHLRLQRKLQESNIAAIAQLDSTTIGVQEELGYIVLGPKKSGQQYNSQDIRTLETIIDGLIIAIQNALRFEEIQNFTVTLQEKIDIATSKLQKSNDKLKQMDETKDEFISMASHQLRTPLTSVKGYLSMVIEGDAGKLNEMQQKLLSQAYISSQRMVFLIADLLNVSRLRTGKFVIEAAPTNLAEVVQGEVDQLMDTAEGRNLKLEYEKPANFPTYMLDETKLRQVIMNFMDNAIYYTPSGGHISVKLKSGKDTVEFTVTDNGMGVPKHEQHHLFNKFYRAGNARKARPDGTGLGLFMAKKVVIAQGGSILFKSQEGKGSTFGFTFSKSHLIKPDETTNSAAAPVPVLTAPAGSEAKATLSK